MCAFLSRVRWAWMDMPVSTCNELEGRREGAKRAASAPAPFPHSPWSHLVLYLLVVQSRNNPVPMEAIKRDELQKKSSSYTYM